jgi:hypothetical protein
MSLDALKPRAAAVGVVGLALTGVGFAVAGKDQFFRSYLLGFVYWLGIAFGCLAIQMIHALTGGRWGPPIRRTLYAASSTLPLFVLLFVPILFGMTSLYPWARPEAASDHLLQHKARYLNVPFFIARAAVCFMAWVGLALALYARSVRAGHRPPTAKMRVVSGPGILLGALTMSVAAIDWLMSLDPHWFSTMFPVIVVVGQLLSGMCFAILLLVLQRRLAGEPVPIDPLHDLGNLLLLFVMLWAYVSYSQYLIIYAGNIAEETPFYVHRTEGHWKSVSFALIVLHFAVPFLLLISRRTKRSPQILAGVALGLLLMRFVENFWIVAPNFPSLSAYWVDIAATVGIGGVWAAYFLHRFGRRELARVASERAA